MSLAINVNEVHSVLLLDGWHSVSFNKDGISSFDLDSYEYYMPHPTNPDKDRTLLGTGNDPLISTKGATWISTTNHLYNCPLTSILAIRMRRTRKNRR